MTAPRILVIDDEADLRWVLAELFREAGFDVEQAADGQQGLAAAERHRPDVVLTDARMPNLDGVQLLARLQQLDRDLPVILLSALEEIATAVAAMKLGAYDWLQKPFDRERLLRTVHRALEHRRLRGEAQHLAPRPVDFGNSPRARELERTIALVAAQDRLGVMLVGESGTGKEVVAREIHARSARAAGPFVAIDCGALPETLLESQLFGHRKGAFTGADQDRPGLFRAADHGTLFLDELGNLPLALQSKLLRALQERAVVAVGGGAPVAFDARLITATNADLQAAVRAQQFRIDLYHRVAEFVVAVPALRERPEDVLPMAELFLAEACAEMDRRVDGFTAAAADSLRGHAWPGNLRELRNAVRRAVVVSTGSQLDAVDLSLASGLGAAAAGTAPVGHAPAATPSPAAAAEPLADRLRRATDKLEAEILKEALTTHAGNKAAAARALQIDYTTLHRKLKRHGLA